MGRSTATIEPRSRLDELGRQFERLLRVGPRGSAACPRRPDRLLEPWIASLLQLREGPLLLRLRTRKSQLSLREEGGPTHHIALELPRLCERAEELGLRGLAISPRAPEHELFHIGALLLSIAVLPRDLALLAEANVTLRNAQLRDVQLWTSALPSATQTPRPAQQLPPTTDRLVELSREATRVLLHDIRGLPARSLEREALVRILLALLSQAAREGEEQREGLFHSTVEDLGLGQEEWSSLVAHMDPHAAESFLWAFLERIPKHPAPELYEALLARAHDILPTMLEHHRRVGSPGVRRIVEFVLRQEPEHIEQLLRSEDDQEVLGALHAFEQASIVASSQTLIALTTSTREIQLRCLAAQQLLQHHGCGNWALELLEDNVRPLRRIALQALSGQREHLAAMIASYEDADTKIDDEERRWRLFAIAACGDLAARAFLHERLELFPEADAMAGPASPEQLEELRARINL
jgi:hypothetical protein